MTLEQQLTTLAGLGLELDDGISIDDLLYSFEREEYEKRPFDLVLFVLGIEVERAPLGRPFCSRVWSFDRECITSPGDYTRIVKRLCQVAGNPCYIKNIRYIIDIDTGMARLKYKINDTERKWPVGVNENWGNRLTLDYVMDDIECEGHRFYFKSNGQTVVLFFLDSKKARVLNRLSNKALKPVLEKYETASQPLHLTGGFCAPPHSCSGPGR